MLSTSTQAEQRVLLQNISWQTFETLLIELGEHRSLRLAYDQGTLEIMTPDFEHENDNRLLERFVFTFAEELNINIKAGGSTTLKREDLARGLEPDSCYYIQNEALVRDKKKIDLSQDPPPDLVLEVDITSGSLNKLPVYAALGVPEIWRYDGQTLCIYRLEDNSYVECEQSPTFPLLPISLILQFLEQSKVVGETSVLRAFRAWVRNTVEGR